MQSSPIHIVSPHAFAPLGPAISPRHEAETFSIDSMLQSAARQQLELQQLGTFVAEQKEHTLAALTESSALHAHRAASLEIELESVAHQLEHSHHVAQQATIDKSRLEARCASLTSSLRRTAQRLGRIEEAESRQREAVALLRDKCNRLSSDLDYERGARIAAEQEAKESKQRASAADEAAVLAARQSTLLEARLIALRQDYDMREARHRDDMAQLESALREATKQRNALVDAVATLEEQLAASVASARESRHEASNLRLAHKQESEARATLQIESSRLRDQLRGEETLRRMSEAELHELRSEHEKNTSELRHTASERAHAAADLRDKTKSLERTRAALDETRRHVERLEQELATTRSHLASNETALLVAQQEARDHFQASLLAREQCDATRLDLVRLQGHDDALRQCDFATLQALCAQSEQALPRMRRALLEVRELETAEAHSCPVCLAHPRNCALNCGHVLCHDCSARLGVCPVCRGTIHTRTRLFV